MEAHLRYLGGGGSSHNPAGGTTQKHNLAYDLGIISIFLMLVFYVISNGIITKNHVSPPNNPRSVSCTLASP